MYFTDSHEWISLKGNRGRVGITEHAQKELGEIVYVELPKLGQIVEAGMEASVLESTKAAADVYTPVSGKITAVHDLLKENIQTLNQDPELTGWIFEIELSHPQEIDRLMTRDEYLALLSPR